MPGTVTACQWPGRSASPSTVKLEPGPSGYRVSESVTRLSALHGLGLTGLRRVWLSGPHWQPEASARQSRPPPGPGPGIRPAGSPASLRLLGCGTAILRLVERPRAAGAGPTGRRASRAGKMAAGPAAPGPARHSVSGSVWAVTITWPKVTPRADSDHPPGPSRRQ